MENMRERLVSLIREVCTAACMICCDTDAHEYMADEYIKAGVFLPPCKVGDKAYILLDPEYCDVDEEPISEDTITEVGGHGFWISDCLPPQQDMGTFISWEQVGVDAFLSRTAAEEALNKKEDA